MRRGIDHSARISDRNNEPLQPLFEVFHNDGATPLFLAIEEAKWHDALDIARSFPEQIQTWVIFKESRWRRLPIHEACRNQAPAWIISTLLSSFPESAYLKTQHDELPLHQAVEFGAAPEVVNLMVVANWEAIVTRDKLGRAPLDILAENVIIGKEERRIIEECLHRCYISYNNVQNSARKKDQKIQREGKEENFAPPSPHQDNLEKKVEALESMVNDLRELVHAKDVKIQRLQKDAANRESRIDELSTDLRNVAQIYDRDMRDSLDATEQSMRVMVGAQIALKKQIAGQAQGLQALIEARQINLPKGSELLSQNQESLQKNHSVSNNNGLMASSDGIPLQVQQNTHQSEKELKLAAREAKRRIERKYYRRGVRNNE